MPIRYKIGRKGGGKSTTPPKIHNKSFHRGPLKETNHEKVVQMKSPWCNLTPPHSPHPTTFLSPLIHRCFNVEKRPIGCPRARAYPSHTTASVPHLSSPPPPVSMQSWGHMICCTLLGIIRIAFVHKDWGEGVIYASPPIPCHTSYVYYAGITHIFTLLLNSL